MKRVITFTLVIVIALFSCMTVSASETETTGNIYVIDDITVIFDESSTLTEEEQQYIAEYLVFGNESETYGLVCSIFGHKYVNEIISVITHCVRDLSPRCKRETYEVNTCGRCGKVEQELLSTVYIVCCPVE